MPVSDYATVDREGNLIYPQAGLIPFRRKGGEVEVLLITTLKRKRWVIPKGLIEPDLSPAESALMEAEEEAGIQGTVDSEPLGTYEYRKWGGTCRVEVYAMRVNKTLDDWPEAETRSREWFSIEEAVERVAQNGLKSLIRCLSDKLPDQLSA
jgi:8-oxo-dGTP pyrophosphatase MutT (NUDIX family)